MRWWRWMIETLSKYSRRTQEGVQLPYPLPEAHPIYLTLPSERRVERSIPSARPAFDARRGHEGTRWRQLPAAVERISSIVTRKRAGLGISAGVNAAPIGQQHLGDGTREQLHILGHCGWHWQREVGSRRVICRGGSHETGERDSASVCASACVDPRKGGVHVFQREAHSTDLAVVRSVREAACTDPLIYH